MTATEPELTLMAVEGGDSSGGDSNGSNSSGSNSSGVDATGSRSEVSPEPSRFGLLGRALWGSFAGVLLSVVLSLIFFDRSYPGVRDDAVAEQAVATYRPFLEAIGRQLAWLGLAQALC